MGAWLWACIAMVPPWLVGMLVFWHVVRPQKPPADISNRLNKLRAVWFVLTREDYLAPHFPWWTRDEMGNVRAMSDPQLGQDTNQSAPPPERH